MRPFKQSLFRRAYGLVLAFFDLQIYAKNHNVQIFALFFIREIRQKQKRRTSQHAFFQTQTNNNFFYMTFNERILNAITFR